jgi:release factor glutamine methyltransferase
MESNRIRIKNSQWTIEQHLQKAHSFLKTHGILQPRRDAELIMRAVLKWDIAQLILRLKTSPAHHQAQAFWKGIYRRSLHEPIQYIVQHLEFFGIALAIKRGILIPRPETELLVEEAIRFLVSRDRWRRPILDLGTGSGCIAISLATRLSSEIWAVDQSSRALAMARINAKKNVVQARIHYRRGNWFEALRQSDPRQFEAILCNPPYLAWDEKNTLDLEVSYYEPHEALFAEREGLEHYWQLAPQLSRFLTGTGRAFFEIHALKAKAISIIFRKYFKHVTIYRDLQDLPRVLIVEKKSKK